MSSKFLIVGLGNIGAEYEQTRHNIGFLVVEKLVKELGGSFLSDRLAFRAEVRHKGRTLVAIKPTTFMNLSGKAVNYWMQTEKIPLENILIVTDDLALPFGTLRMKGKGSDGGHNGLKSIQETLATVNYARLRFGIGNEFAKGSQVNYVLGKWSEEELVELPNRITSAKEFVVSFATIGLQRSMSLFNNK
ncbi:MAG: aminoacyl-tRNA hydrolase [Bacteroidetes bacterium]|nr:aminoacyl-tRNA hydrolase [Bacteroidota bacterium]